MKGKILPKKVLIKPEEAKAKTESGLIIPEKAKEAPNRGEIVLIGKEVDAEVGATVLYAKHAGQELMFNDIEYKLINESDILIIF